MASIAVIILRHVRSTFKRIFHNHYLRELSRASRARISGENSWC